MGDFRRVLQDYRGELDIANGKSVERLLCIFFRDDDSNALMPCIFWLKLAEETCWHRFFVDDVCACWDIYDELNQSDLEEDDVFPVRDIGEQLGLLGKKIVHVDCSEDHVHAVTLKIVFATGEELKVRTTLAYESSVELSRSEG